MEIIITNTKVKIQSLPLVTKGNQSLSSLSSASITGGRYYVLWGLSSCTGLHRVTGINYVPCYYSTEDQQTTRFYKFNKVTNAYTRIAEYTAQDSELGQVKHLDVDVELAENEYIVLSGAMYYSTSGGNSFSFKISGAVLSDNLTTNLWYNIEGVE